MGGKADELEGIERIKDARGAETSENRMDYYKF